MCHARTIPCAGRGPASAVALEPASADRLMPAARRTTRGAPGGRPGTGAGPARPARRALGEGARTRSGRARRRPERSRRRTAPPRGRPRERCQCLPVVSAGCPRTRKPTPNARPSNAAATVAVRQARTRPAVRCRGGRDRRVLPRAGLPAGAEVDGGRPGRAPGHGRDLARRAVPAAARPRRGGLFGLRRWLVARPLAGVEAVMRADLYRHLQRLPVAFHDRWASGQLLSRGRRT